MKGGAAMRVSGYLAAAVMVAGAALVPSTASAAVFTLNQCAVGDCDNFKGSVTISITDNVSDGKLVDFSIDNNSNGDIDYLLFGYDKLVTGNGKVTNFVAKPAGSAGQPSATFANDAN